MSLLRKVKELADGLGNQNNSADTINKLISSYYDEITITEDDEIVGQSMTYLSKLFCLDKLNSGSTASLICGSLIENDYPAKYITDNYIDFINQGITKALPFLEECEKEFQNQVLDEDFDELEIIEEAKQRLKPKFEEAIYALESLDAYYQCGVSIFSSSKKEFEKGKTSLSQFSKYAKYNHTFYWFSQLFNVLFEEAILVIDLTTKKGIKGIINGIASNSQLHILLMTLTELNESVNVPENFIDVVKGFGVQQLDDSISGKWNMYNWEYLKYNSSETSEYWIWSEGIPADISTLKGYRVILLDKPSYSRGLSIQRMFKNLEADIEITETLSLSQVEELLNEIKNSK